MKIKSSNLVFGGISTALITLLLYIGSIIPTNKIFFMAFSIAVGSIPYIKSGIKSGIIVYLASSILSFFMVPNKLYIGIYIIFGIYPFIKLISERYSIAIEYAIKYISFNILVLIAYFVYSRFVYLGPLFENTYLIIGFIVGVQILFYIFDFAFTKCIMFFEDRILKRIK